MNQKTACPLCNSTSIKSLYSISAPVLQNRVYNHEEEAINSSKGEITLTFCKNCTFTFNSTFDNEIIVYDEHYDNSVPSKLFQSYYEDIAHYLYNKYNLNNGYIYDIGCGKGTFLNTFCAQYPNIKGKGIDPSYEGELQPVENLQFIRDLFQESHVTEAPNLILSRHVFEHIEYLNSFLENILKALTSFKDIPFFIEVPSFEWIVGNNAFWDICYEHCNYFSAASLKKLFDVPNVSLQSITAAFNAQYFWVEGIINPTDKPEMEPISPEHSFAKVEGFINAIEHLRSDIQSSIECYKQRGYKIVLWGMATKGVIFSNLIDPNKQIIDYCIDINKGKQNKYTPTTGHKIEAPQSLIAIRDAQVVVIAMNTNYLAEIKKEALSYCADCLFVDAHGNIM